MVRPWRTVVALLGIAAGLLHAVPASADDDPGYSWSVAAVQQPPATMHPGEIVTLTVALRNDGPLTWFGEDLSSTPFRLGTTSPRDRVSAFALEDPTWLWSGGRRIRMATPVVPSGAVGTFTFTFRAPSTPPYPRSFVEHVAPLVEGGPWLDDDRIALSTTVVPISGLVPAVPSPTPVPSPPPQPTVPPIPTPTPVAGYAWEPVATQPAPAAMHPGMKIALTVTLRNTGTETWFAEEGSATPMRLAAVNAASVLPRERTSAFGRQDPTWIWSQGRRIRMVTPQVAPGQLGTFTFSFTAPASATYPQNHVERFAPIVEGVALLDQQLITFTTQVRPVVSVIPPIPEVPDIPSPEPLPSVIPSPLPTPVPVPTGLPVPTTPPTPGLTCLTSAQPRIEDVIPPALAYGYSANGTLLSDRVDQPSAVAYGFAKLFAADPVNDRILKTDLAGFVVESFGSSGSGPGQLREPSGLSVTDSGVLFVADTGNDRIQIFGFGGVFTTMFGSSGDLPGQFRSPHGIEIIRNGPLEGNLIVADTGNDRIQILSRTGAPIAVIGGPGEEPGRFSSPTSVSVWQNSIFVADTGNQRIQRLALDGTFEASWGGDRTDGGCTSVPTGVLATAYGVFVTEAGSSRVEHFTRWGAPVETFGALDQPTAITIDPSAKLYVSEGGADRITRFVATVAIAPPLPD